ncbi:MAG: thioredoxin family protein [Cytophagaceae bacterium]
MKDVRPGIFSLLFIVIMSSCSTYSPEVSNGMMLGEVDLYYLEDMFWFQRNYRQYNPETQNINVIKKLPKDANIVFVGGIWHAQTQRMLPQLIKSADQANIKQEKISVYFIDTELKSPEQWEKKFNVRSIPTCIVIKNGLEIARVEGIPDGSLDSELALQLQKRITSAK